MLGNRIVLNVLEVILNSRLDFPNIHWCNDAKQFLALKIAGVPIPHDVAIFYFRWWFKISEIWSARFKVSVAVNIQWILQTSFSFPWKISSELNESNRIGRFHTSRSIFLRNSKFFTWTIAWNVLSNSLDHFFSSASNDPM